MEQDETEHDGGMKQDERELLKSVFQGEEGKKECDVSVGNIPAVPRTNGGATRGATSVRPSAWTCRGTWFVAVTCLVSLAMVVIVALVISVVTLYNFDLVGLPEEFIRLRQRCASSEQRLKHYIDDELKQIKYQV